MLNRAQKEPARKRKRDLSQYGSSDVPSNIGLDNTGSVDEDVNNDNDLEVEITTINSGENESRQKPKPRVQVTETELGKMVAESLRDIDSDEDISGDDDDPDLLDELSAITGNDERGTVRDESAAESPAAGPPPLNDAEKSNGIILPTTVNNTIDLITSRIEMYKIAEEAAEKAEESGRARRFNRGLKTLETLLKQVQAGRTVNTDEIPPEVCVKTPDPSISTQNECVNENVLHRTVHPVEPSTIPQSPPTA